MKSISYSVIALCTATLFIGCANQTTDPRKGGLFSYNPGAYEERLDERRDALAEAEKEKLTSQQETSKLEAEKSAQTQEKAVVEAQLQQLNSSVASLEKDVQAKQAKTAAQKKEQQRILSEINSVKSSSRLADEMEDPEEKRLELERLKKRRDQLEKESANLMLL